MMRWLSCVVLGALLWGPGLAVAQQPETIRITIPEGGVGLEGLVRPGSWCGIRLVVDNLGDDREVLFRWVLNDDDGDTVWAERAVTLTRQRNNQNVWLYAAVPMKAGPNTPWSIRATDAQSGALLTKPLQFTMSEKGWVSPNASVIGVTSSADLGLNDYQRHETRHEPIRLARGSSLSRLPDRWMGLAHLSTYIWTQDQGDDPADPVQTPEASLEAMRQWVYRGGHLVIVLPAVGQTWTGSPLADMLPVTGSDMRTVNTTDWPLWLGGLRQENRPPIRMTVFDVDDAALETQEPSGGPRPTVLLRDSEGRAVAVAGRYGFGRVTMLGLDLTQRPLMRERMPFGNDRMWNRLFGWISPVLSRNYAEAQIKDNQMVAASKLDQVQLGDFISDRIAMTGTVGAVLLGALVLFGVYWVVAGWLLQPVLKSQGKESWTWPAFVAVVLVVAGVAWGGAALLRPSDTTVSHLSILDIDGNTGIAHSQSFMSTFVPRFGDTELKIGSERISTLAGDVHNTLGSPGTSVVFGEAGFIDPQRYTLPSANPSVYDVPMRATSKQMRADYLGPVDSPGDGLADGWGISPSQSVQLGEDGWPVTELTHTLPGKLTNVIFIYCPGEGYRRDRGDLRELQTPWVWRYDDADKAWDSSETLKIAGPPKQATRLNRRLPIYPVERAYETEGYLGQMLAQQKGGVSDLPQSVDRSVIARQFNMLSFFEALPPPNYRNIDFPRSLIMQRRLGHGMDLTQHIAGRRLIIIGHLPESTLPMPFTIDGQTPPSEGWTVVRWVYDF